MGNPRRDVVVTSRRHRLFGVLAGLAVIVLVSRVIAPAVGIPIARLTYRVFDALALDDEMPALSVPAVVALTWPYDEAPVRALLQHVLLEEANPNDLLVYAVASGVAKRVSPQEARAIFLNEVHLVRTGEVERRYLAVALLPLGLRGGLCSKLNGTDTLVSTYREVHWPLRPGEPPNAKDVAFVGYLRACGVPDGR
jgi:hypothetical protein